MDALLVAAPAVVFGIVALLGFTGCWLPDSGTGPVSPATTPETYSDVVLDSGPIAFWKLTDSPGSTQAADEIPTPPGAHPGTYDGAVLLGMGPSLDASDPAAAPARFGGSQVVVAQDSAFQTDAFSVEAWVLPFLDDPPVFGTIVSNFSADGNNGWGLYCAPPVPGDVGVYGYWSMQTGFGTGSGGPQTEIDMQKLEPAVHLVMTYDGSLRLYVNGALEKDVPGGFAMNMTDPILIGTGFRGAIQGVAVYGRALDGDEVVGHFVANRTIESDGGP
jgi:hypothetical protein